MIIVAAALAIAAFLLGFNIFAIVPAARNAVVLARDATGVMRDPDLSDDEKEKAIQKAAIGMFAAAFSLFWRISATLLLTALPVFLLDVFGLVDQGAVYLFLARPEVIVGASVLVIGLLWGLSRLPKSSSSYSLMDRTVHRLAFAAPFVQMTAADIEDSAFAGDVRDIEDKPPVFITSLPRAGTTIVLNAMHAMPGVATHLYRDMPFVMAPLLWSRLSGSFKKAGDLHERAHGDGIEIGFDSPEAFEEVIWRQFWPDHFAGERIRLWTEDDLDSEASEFFRRHFRKIVALRCGPGGRYVSKNNGNVGRLRVLGKMFPGAGVVVPLRDPAEHAASLLRQHLNFLGLHRSDPFVERYMRDIGHLEFGALHKPLNFAGFAEAARGLTPEDPDYWLAYWIAAARDIEANAAGLLILPEAELQADPNGVMTRLAGTLSMDTGGVDFGQFIHKIPPRADEAAFEPDRLSEARALYRALAEIGRKRLEI